MKVGCSPINGTIYCGNTKITKGVEMWVGKKHDITSTAVSAVANHLLVTDSYMEYEINGQKYELRMVKVN